jgi:hypothetical protein
MVQIAGKPFTQLTNLNLLDELRVDGVVVVPGTGAQVILEETASSLVTIDDDIISYTISLAAVSTLPAASSAIKHVVIKNAPTSTATLTVTPDGSDLIENAASQLLTTGQALTLFPITGGWLIS